MVGRTLSHYRVVERLGAGGMGVVYLAHDEQLDRTVALKVLPPGVLSVESARRRFHKEALALGRLNHPNIETVYDCGSDGGVDFVVTEFVPGDTLAARVAQGSLSDLSIRDIGAQIAAGLIEAHAQGVLHCDLKPGNVILTPKGHIKLIDFGLARLMPRNDQDATETQTVGQGITGTLAYLPPERFQGRRATAQSDIYAVGTILYELGSGRPPFNGDTQGRLVAAILSQPVPALRDSNPAISVELDRVVTRCLHKDPAQRYSSAWELLNELSPASAAATLPLAQPRVLVGSNWRKTLGAAAAALMLLVFLLLYWSLGAGRALSFSSRDWILTADLDNKTGDPLFDRSLSEAFTVSLEQSTHANVVPRARINEALRRMGKPNDLKVDEPVGRELCLREDVRGLVTLAIAKVGRRYVLTSRLVNPQTGDTVRSYLQRAEDQDRILDALGAIATQIRRDLGESLGSIRRSERRLALVTTPSLTALKAYSDGNYLWSRSSYDLGLKGFLEATAIDPDFAMAHGSLGIAYCSHIYNNRPKCQEHFHKALSLVDRVTNRERLFLLAEVESSVGRQDEAIRRWQQYLEAYPDDVGSRYNFASMLMHDARTEEAIPQFQEVIRLAPNYASAYINLATSYSQRGSFPESLANYRKAFELEPSWVTNSNLNHEYGFTFVRSGAAVRAREVFALAVAKPESKANGLRSLALLDLYEGKWRSAVAELREACRLRHAGRAGLSESREHFHLAAAHEEQGDRAAALAELDKATIALDSTPAAPLWMASRVGVAYARAGALDRAERALRKMKPHLEANNPAQNAVLLRLQAELALARGHPSEAIALLASYEVDPQEAPIHLASLAHAYDRAGRTGEAIATYEKLVAAKNRSIAWEALYPWREAQLRLAELQASQGNPSRAAELLDSVAADFSNADPDLLMLRQIARLRKTISGSGGKS